MKSLFVDMFFLFFHIVPDFLLVFHHFQWTILKKTRFCFLIEELSLNKRLVSFSRWFQKIKILHFQEKINDFFLWKLHLLDWYFFLNNWWWFFIWMSIIWQKDVIISCDYWPMIALWPCLICTPLPPSSLLTIIWKNQPFWRKCIRCSPLNDRTSSMFWH